MTATSAGDIDALAKEISEIAQTHDLTRRVTITGSRSEVRLAVAMNQLLDGLGAREKHLRTMMDSMKDATDDAQTANKLLKRVKDELKSRKVQLADAVAKASAANTAKSQFLANMSHEIRTPMNGILGTAELLARTPLEGKQERYVGTILRSGRALLTIINDILDFSKVESGKIELSDAPFDLVVCIGDVIALLTPTCTAKNIELHLIVEPDLPHFYLGDVGRIRQILTNIIGNSVKFTDEGCVTVTLSGHTIDGKVGLRFEVRDTGIGIPANKVNDVFEKFSQVDNTSARRHEGTGLGLAICKSLIERMGGGIGVESTVGLGSMFWFTLPLHVYEQPVTLDDVTQSFSLEGRRVLMVAKNDAQATPVRGVLQGFGCDVRTVVGPIDKSAVDGFSEANGVLLVVMESVETSEAFLREIANLRSVAPPARLSIIAVAADGANEDAAKYVDAGAQAYLNGEIGDDELRDAVETVLRHAADRTSQLVTRYSLDEDRRARETPPDMGVMIDPIAAGRNKVLLVEDSLVNQEVARDFLESMGCVVECVRNGREAVDAVARQAFDVVLMDCQMPVMDGFQATRAIRESEMSAQTPRIPIIALTANAFESDQKKCMAAGMSDFLSKPFDPEQFESTVRKWLSRPDNITHGEVLPHVLVEIEQGEPADVDPAFHDLDEIRLSFEAWSSATNDAARSLLLSGPVLTMAEHYLRTRPHDIPEEQENYILRSLAAQTRRGVTARTVREAEKPQRDGRAHWMVLAVAVVGIAGLSAMFGTRALDWAFDIASTPHVAALPTPTPSPEAETIEVAAVQPAPPAPMSPLPSEAPSAAPEQPRGVEDQTRVVLVIPPAPEAVKPAKRDATADDIRTLATVSKTAATNGNRRVALLLAVEAVRETNVNPALLADAHLARQMRSSLFGALATQTHVSSGGEVAARGMPPLCHDGARSQGLDWSALSSRTSAVDPSCGRRLVLAPDYAVQVVEIDGGRVLANLVGHQSEIVSSAFDPTGRVVVTASRDATARLWDGRTGRTLAQLTGHDYALLGAGFNSDGHQVVTWSEDKTARVWDVRSGRQIARLAGHQGTVTKAVFSADDQLLLTTSNDGSARVWATGTGALLATLLPDRANIVTANFSRDGRRVVTQQHNGGLIVWDVATRTAMSTLIDPTGATTEHGLSTDGRWLVTATAAGAITLWNAETGSAFADLHRAGQRTSAMGFSADGTHLIALSQDGGSTRWPTVDALESAVETALGSAGTCLSTSERAALALDPAMPEWCGAHASPLTR